MLNAEQKCWKLRESRKHQVVRCLQSSALKFRRFCAHDRLGRTSDLIYILFAKFQSRIYLSLKFKTTLEKRRFSFQRGFIDLIRKERFSYVSRQNIFRCKQHFPILRVTGLNLTYGESGKLMLKDSHCIFKTVRSKKYLEKSCK